MTYIITTIITIVLIVIATFNGITIFCVHDIVVSTFLAAGLASFMSALPLEIKEFIYKPRDATPTEIKLKLLVMPLVRSLNKFYCIQNSGFDSLFFAEVLIKILFSFIST